MSMNPFSYGRPIDDIKRFVGRRREIEQVYSRLLAACESTSIVGESRMGKTSLLKAIAHPETQASFGIDQEKYVFIFQDFQFIDSGTTPTQFWKRLLRSMKRALKHKEDLVQEIDAIVKQDDLISNYTLDDIFALIDDEDLHIILMFDEFENITRNEHFDNDFFGGLRALAIHHNLALITSSRQDLVELTHSDQLRSSPFFNIFATITLRAFTETEATALIDNYLSPTEVKFLPSELNMIFALAGFHPYFLQMTCYHLFAAYEAGREDSVRRTFLVNQVRSEGAPIFQNYWHASTSSQHILMIVLMMRELEDIKENTVEALEVFYNRAAQVLPELERRALIAKNPDDNSYHLFSTELREWIADEIIGSTDDLRAWRNWQKDETLIGALPVTMQDILADIVRSLNPAYRDTFSNFLLDPDTARVAMGLVQQFVSRYEQYKETRSERDPGVALAGTEKPVGNTPKGIFTLMQKHLDDREKGKVTSQPSSAEKSTPAKPKLQSRGAAATSTRRLTKKAPISSIALGGLIMSGIVTTLDLEEEAEDYVNTELKWLFNAIDNFVKVYRQEIDRVQAVSVPIPPDAVKTAQANNAILVHLSASDIESLHEPIERQLEQTNESIKMLNLFLDQEISGGLAAKTDIGLQNKIKDERLKIMKSIKQLAVLTEQVYG
ncbi:MAG: AAA-like domain-containing protein, partial [Anaerolineae bacterium]|nr:AAA-like domain-containing protein [Anaerolineae bacterium]